MRGLPSGWDSQLFGIDVVRSLHGLIQAAPGQNTMDRPCTKETSIMLRLAVVFLVIALLAALLGFGGVASYSFEGARIFAFIFIVLAVLSFIGGRYRRPSI